MENQAEPIPIPEEVVEETVVEQTTGPMTSVKRDPTFEELAQELLISGIRSDKKVIVKGQYKDAMMWLELADAAGLVMALIGPPGTGKTTLVKHFAKKTGRVARSYTFEEASRAPHFVGSHDPSIVLKEGYSWRSFSPGNLTEAFVNGGVFIANEPNRATEFVQNALLDVLEERELEIPQIGKLGAPDTFYVVLALNPGESAGTHKMSDALKDRINVWFTLMYPDRETEKEVIEAQVPDVKKIEPEFLDMIMNSVIATREHRDIKRPASIRQAIAAAKLACKVGKKLDAKMLTEILRMVMTESFDPRPNCDRLTIMDEILAQQGLR